MKKLIEERITELTIQKDELLKEYPSAEVWVQNMLADRNANISMELKFLNKLSKLVALDGWIEFAKEKPKEKGEYFGYFPKGVEGSGGKEDVDMCVFNGEKLYSAFPNSTAHCFEATYWKDKPEKPNL